MVQLKACILVSVLALTASGVASSKNRIIGGRNAVLSQYPYFVHLERGCGGSLIAADLILTAAHCFDTNTANMSVRINHYNETREITSINRHPRYNRQTMEYDLLIARISEPVKNITYADINNDKAIPVEMQELTVIGMGSTSASSIRGVDRLQEATVYALPEDACSEPYGDLWMGEESMLCAGTASGGADSCRGDSGGPILDSKTDRIVGVVSVGHDCGDKDFPGVYARLSSAVDWIRIAKCTFSAYPFRPDYCPQPSPNAVASITYANNSAAGSPFIVPATTVVDSGLTVQIDIHYDLYAIENKWELRYLDTDEIIDEQPYYTVKPEGLSRRTYHGLEPGEYTFEIVDFAKDGICCRFGDGYIRITQLFNDNRFLNMEDRELGYIAGNFTERASLIFYLDPLVDEPEYHMVNGTANATNTTILTNSSGIPLGNFSNISMANDSSVSRINTFEVSPTAAPVRTESPHNTNIDQEGATSTFTINIP